MDCTNSNSTLTSQKIWYACVKVTLVMQAYVICLGWAMEKGVEMVLVVGLREERGSLGVGGAGAAVELVVVREGISMVVDA